MSSADGSEAIVLAEEAYGLVQARPAQAASLARRAAAAARSEGDFEAQVLALHTLSWAQRVIGDPRAARTARAGIRVGERFGARRRVALLRRNLAHTLLFAGSIRAARREIEAALADLTGRDRAESEVFRIAIHGSAHAVDERVHRAVLASAARALRVFRVEGDELWQARLLYNRATLHLARIEPAPAARDYRRAYELYCSAGADAAAVDAAVGLAEVALLDGEVVTCLETVAEVRSKLPPGTGSFSLDYCYASALAQAQLLPEAESAVSAYLAACLGSGRRDYASVALLDSANIALASGNPSTALQVAKQAARSLASQDKPVHAARARVLCLRAALAEGSLRPSAVRSGREAAAILEKARWRHDALRAHLVVARAALGLGRPSTARRHSRMAMPLRTNGAVLDRLELCWVRALLSLRDGDVARAQRLLRSGLRLLEDHRGALGAVELRASVSRLGTELSATGLRIAVDSRNPAKVLAWAERLRANALRLPVVRPPRDAQLRARQAELRRVVAQIRETEDRGTPDRRLAARQVELETAIRNRTRLVRGEGGTIAPIPRPREAAQALGERVLVEYVELDGVLRAVTLARGRLRLHELGAVEVTTELEWLRFALGRLARGGNSPAQRTALIGNAEAAAAALDRLLVEPLLPTLGDAPLVLVPTGPLHALPWGALPSLRGRGIVVAPSLSLWFELARRPRSRRTKAALIAGPRLRHATTEVNALSTMLPSATVLQGKAATAAAVVAALDGAAVAHVACHGRFRSDSPLFSSLELADGPLNVLELQRLRRAPEILVLSSCDVALSERHPGDELLGLAAALLAMRTRTIIASVVPVPDAASRRLMLAFHRELADGAPPATALARAQASLRRRSAALAGFVCLGSG